MNQLRTIRETFSGAFKFICKDKSTMQAGGKPHAAARLIVGQPIEACQELKQSACGCMVGNPSSCGDLKCYDDLDFRFFLRTKIVPR